MNDETLSHRTGVQIGGPTVNAATIQGFPSVPGYDILRELGRGGMGVVYEARQTQLDRAVALKLMKGDDPLHKARFLAEGQVIAAVKHPHVVAVYDFGESSIGPFIAMEFLTGGTFAGLLARETVLAPAAAAELIAQVASGVGAAHDVGIVHRDLKPGNVLLDASGSAKVADFGLAKRATSDLTATQAMMGTPSYMAPEQAAGKGKFVGPAADVWSLGIMLYEALTGKRPFSADEVGSLLVAIQNDDPPSLRSHAKGIPPDLETICLKCLEKEPERRYLNAGEMRADLEAWRDGRPIAARRATRAERGLMWVRRKPTVAAAWALAVLVFLLSGLTITAVNSWRRAEADRISARNSEAEARAQKANAEAQRANAEAQRAIAEKQEALANSESFKAREAERKSNEQKNLAVQALDEARRATLKSDVTGAILRELVGALAAKPDAGGKPADLQRFLGKTLVAIGQQGEQFRGPVIQILTEQNRFAKLLPEMADREVVVKWRTAQLQAMADDLRARLNALAKGNYAKNSETILAIREKLDEFKDAKKQVAAEFGADWNEKYVAGGIVKLAALATVWEDARTGRGEAIKPLRELVQADVPPDLAVALTMEYLRVGIERGESVADLRRARDASRKWLDLVAEERRRIDHQFQIALALRVRGELAGKERPKWDEIFNLCGEDGALGWALASKAERRLESGFEIGDLSAAEKDTTADETYEDRRAFLVYLKAVATGDATAVAELKALLKAPPPILTAPFRRERIAKLAPDATMKPKVEEPSTVPPMVATKPVEKEYVPSIVKTPEAILDGWVHPDLATAKAEPDEKKTGPADLTFAMAYYYDRAGGATADRPTRLAAFAAAARLAYRLMEVTFDPNEDAKTREAALLPRIATFAKNGLDLPGGNNVDRLSLRLSLFRKELLTAAVYNADWLNVNTNEIESIAKDLPRGHPDYADALAYRAFVTLMRFSVSYGNLNGAKSEEAERIRAWNRMIADAEAAFKIDPDNDYANRTLGVALLGTFKEYTPVYPPPESLKTAEFVRNKDIVLKTDGHLKRATDAMKTRKQPFIWRMRSVFLFQAANALAKAGESPADVKRMLQDAALSAQKSDEQRDFGQKVIDDPLLLGRIREDLAWLGQYRPAENYGAAIQSFDVAATRPQNTPDRRLQNIRRRVDHARTVVRAVQYGYFPAARLAEADAALDALKADIAKLPEAEREYNGVKIELAKGVYWRAVGQLAAGKSADAEKSFAEAAEAVRSYAADLYAFSLLHRAEAALAGKLAAGAAGTILQDSVEKLRPVLEAEGAVAIRNTLAFAPDYLLARKALEENEGGAARTHFAAAYDKIKRAKNARTLLVEDSFALRCLAHEINNVKLNATDLKARQDLLVELEKVYSWSLTPADQKLVAAALPPKK